MRAVPFALAVCLSASAILPAAAQTASQVEDAARSGSAKTGRAPSPGQTAARDRQKKCGQEWREAKAKNETGGMKWPQYWSKCNARLKGGGNA